MLIRFIGIKLFCIKPGWGLCEDFKGKYQYKLANLFSFLQICSMAFDNPPSNYLNTRGAQLNTPNKFLKNSYVHEHTEALDEPWVPNGHTQVFEEHPKKIVSESSSPDLPHMFSINPYQGCEHGCIYCYARNSHEYYGYSAGLDFERKIIVKRTAPQLLREYFNKKRYKPEVIFLSGNTDCYQPLERKLNITRGLLEVFLQYKNPVSIITKNNVILRDLDLLTELARHNLVHVSISLTTLDEQLRQKLEPRTITASGRLSVIEKLSQHNIPVRVMAAPIIPGLNSKEIPTIVKAAADRGALDAAYTMVRLNGAVGDIFTDWSAKAFPLKADKVLAQIAECHGGQLNDSRYGTRMTGEGKIAESIKQLFTLAYKNHFTGRQMPAYNYSLFTPLQGKQTSLF